MRPAVVWGTPVADDTLDGLARCAYVRFVFRIELCDRARGRLVVALGLITLAVASCKLSDPPTNADVRARLEKPTKECAKAAGVQPRGVSESWEIVVTIAGSGEVERVALKGGDNPKVLACAVEAMKGQKFARFGNFGTGQVERTVTVSISDPSQALTP